MNGFTGGLIVSIICFIVGGFSLKSGIRKQKVCTKLAVAKIVDVIVTHNDGTEKNSYSPVYAFEVDGKEYKGTIGQDSKNKRKFKLGNEHNIKYNPNNPKEFMDAERNTTKITGIIFLVMGIFFLVISIFIK